MPANEKYLVTTSLEGKQSNYTTALADVWLIEPNQKQRKIFGAVRNFAGCVAYGCKGNDSLVVAAIKDNGVVVKDLRSGLSKL